jgi:choline dehydrogenase
MNQSFDYIVVGAGSAGCVLANRLSTDPDISVLLVEAGPSDNSLFIRMPAAFTYAISRSRFDWGYRSEPEEHANGERFPIPRGRVLGGSSSVNAMSFVRGQRQDYDGWADAGLPDWSWDHCLPYFRKMETFSGGADTWRGGEGPLHVRAPEASSPLYQAFLQAADQAGHTLRDNTNGAEQEGFSVMDQTIHEGRRESSATAYLHPVRGRPNLTVLAKCLTRRIVMEDNRAIGIDCLLKGREVRFHAEREVVLSAGAINSPKLLMLSGLGPADHLRRHNIPVVADLVQVGQNLQDHVDVAVMVSCTQPVSTTPALRWHNKGLVGVRWLLTRSGAASTNHFETAGYVRSGPDSTRPDIQYVFIPVLVMPDGSPLPEPHGYQATAMLMHPASRGSVALAGPGPESAPVVHFNYLKDDRDVAMLRRGVTHLREIFGQAAFDPYRGREVVPGPKLGNGSELETFLRANLRSTHHPCGTCRMGSDVDAVVDGQGRVRGVEALRVVDASIMPTLTSGNINAPVIMLAEKLADAILGREPPAP